MININEFREFVLFVMNKSGNGEEPTAAEFNRVVDNSLAEWTSIKIGNPRLYQPGRPIPPQSIDITERIIQDLLHLKTTRDFFIGSNQQAQSGNLGRVIVPNGTQLDAVGVAAPSMMYFLRLEFDHVTQSGISTMTIRREIRQKNTNQVPGILSSKIVEPTAKRPICEQYDDFIQIYPKNINKVSLTYLRIPNTPVWGSTVVNNRRVYDASTSTDIDAPYLNKNDIAMIYLKYQGIHLNDTQLAQFANEMQLQGV